MSNFRQSILGRQSLADRQSPADRQSLAGRQSLLGRPGSSIPRLTTATVVNTTPPANNHHHNSNSNLSNNSNSKLNSSVRLNSSVKLHPVSSRATSEVYHFPLLKPQAIVSCLADVQVSCTEEELARPTQQKMMQIYETFLDIVTGRKRDDMTLDNLQSMNVSPHPEYIYDGVRFYIFLNQLTSMMRDVGITDFTSRDLTRPEAERVRRILSAVINFAKFKEDRQGVFYQELRTSDSILEIIAERDREHEILKAELEALRLKKIAQEPQVEELKASNQKLAEEMQVYKKREVQMTRQKDEVTKDRLALNEKNKELSAALEKSTKELNALQAQRVEVPKTLEQDLVQIPESIQSIAGQIEQYRKQIQSRYADVEKMESVPRDLSMILEMMADTLRLLELVQQDISDVNSVKSQIEKERLSLSTLRTKLEQNERRARGLEDKSSALLRTQQTKRAQQEAESMELEKSRQEAEEKLVESRRALEEIRRRNTEIFQREEKWAQDVTSSMEQLKHQFECYVSVVSQAMRLN
ncbi:Nuf2 family-domain-containing protein [Gamsiella multidivaricata]|uniref:Nuf2 family-domain-containing protein n=1 Tax=Gamsiella multidivaricata TaxID=101098 RepID=UPI002220B1D3|nr:Nuf2 family-domain-containing protein [Gamsiella multidivaricata]KAG0360846.1 kinetochore-associated Ndc80 complex subunit nuf2 [Gamsiella multidivaricata]KAI7817611.1 Nuf2 family-domain-containing protein [Gamsiella multidivaricata]